MKKITLNDIDFFVKEDEFPPFKHPEWTTLQLYPQLGPLERVVGIIRDLQETFSLKTYAHYDTTHGGYIPLTVAPFFEKVSVLSNDTEIIRKNVTAQNRDNVSFEEPENVDIMYRDNSPSINDDTILLTSTPIEEHNHIEYVIREISLYVYIPKKYNELFLKDFHYYITESGDFDYNNLVELCIMVKDAGDGFKEVLETNLPHIDRWTILDTGSTDNTVQIIKDVMKVKKGNLYEEPFINFRDSRNRCLDLAGTRCKYTIMLDDTYVLHGPVREFLKRVRSDQYAESYNVFISSTNQDAITYGSNRIVKTEKKLRYKYKIHEIIDTKNNDVVQVPIDYIKIIDIQSSYMSERTSKRKRGDLDLLYEELEKDPDDPRTYYYLAQTYTELDEWEKAIEYFIKRAEHPKVGFKEEVTDSYFNAGFFTNIKLNGPWNTVKQYYKKAFDSNPTRADSLYMLGLNYIWKDKIEKAHRYLIDGFNLGYPHSSRVSIRPNIYYRLLPMKLAQTSMIKGDWKMGLQACQRYMERNKPDETITSYLNIFNLYKNCYNKIIPKKPKIVLVADGGFKTWSGDSIYTEGVGGSETYIIEMARKMAQLYPIFDFYVFCRVSNAGVHDGVRYIDIQEYPKFIRDNEVYKAIISRYSQYIPITKHEGVKDIYLVVHDLLPAGNVLPTDINILCMTNWHRNYFLNTYGGLEQRTGVFPNGINIEKFPLREKKKYSFIYSSFPNRGLIHLLRMFPKIREKLPEATLDVFCDTRNNWVQQVAGEEMREVERLLDESKEWVTNHGWVSKDVLREYWSKAHIWLYPCTFKETFCITALEAAASNTLAVACDLAALKNTVGNRGILVSGDPSTDEWQNEVINRLVSVLNNEEIMQNFLKRNREWAEGHDWLKLAERFGAKFLEPQNSPK